MSVIGGNPQIDQSPFGVLAEDQAPDSNQIVGENTMGHHIGSDIKPGAGAMDENAKRALGIGLYGIEPTVTDEQQRRQRIEQILIAHDQFAANIQSNLLEAYALDPGYFNSKYSHLHKTNLPLTKAAPQPLPGEALMRSVEARPDQMDLLAGYTTFERLLHRKFDVNPLAATKVSEFSPRHPEYKPPDEMQQLRHYGRGGWVDIPPHLYEHFGVTAAQVKDATRKANRRLDEMRISNQTNRMVALEEAHWQSQSTPKVRPVDPNAPQPWKDPK